MTNQANLDDLTDPNGYPLGPSISECPHCSKSLTKVIYIQTVHQEMTLTDDGRPGECGKEFLIDTTGVLCPECSRPLPDELIY